MLDSSNTRVVRGRITWIVWLIRLVSAVVGRHAVQRAGESWQPGLVGAILQ